MPRLENWYVRKLELNHPYKETELLSTSILNGDVYGHERFEDGTFIHTSSIKSINTITNKAQTLNTLYELGKPNPVFNAGVEFKNLVKSFESKEETINDYSHLNIDDIKIKEVHHFEMEFFEFEELVKRVYGHNDYEYVADIECGNDCCQSYDNVQSIGEFDEYDKRHMDEFIKTGKGSYMAWKLLTDMCRKKIIKPGNYLISVCW